MPRWPAGLHRQSGSQRPRAGMVQARPLVTPQQHYWRRTAIPLHAGASWQPPSGFLSLDPTVPLSASTGPNGTGEYWQVDLVSVKAASEYGQPPLVVQQIAAQQSGTTTTPPPPIVAQVWLTVAGVRLHLLGQTTQGGNDDLDLGGQRVEAGEQLTVTWYGAPAATPTVFPSLWFAARGTRYSLSLT